MVLLIIIVWMVLLAVIPLTVMSIANSLKDYELSSFKALFKLSISALGYLISTGIVFVTLIFLFLGPHPGPNHEIQMPEKIISGLVVLGYGGISWVLCSFVKGSIVKPQELFRRDDASQSILFRDTE